MRVGSRRRDLSRATPAAWPGAVVAVIGLLFAAPLVYLVWATATIERDPFGLLASSLTIEPLARSVGLAVAVGAGCAFVGTALAWILHRTDMPGRRWVRVLIPLPLVIPSFVAAAALRSAFGAGGLVPLVPRFDGFWGAWIVLVAVSYPYVYLPVSVRLRSISPSLEEAARLLGRAPADVFRTVVLPQIRLPIGAGALLALLYTVSDFGAVSIMRYDTLTRAIYSSRLFDPGASATLGLLLGTLALAVGFMERKAVSGRDSGGHGSRPMRYTAGRWRLPSVALTVGAVGIGLVAPIVVFVVWWVRGSLAGGGGLADLVAPFADLGGPMVNSALVAVVAAIVTAVIVTPIAFRSVRTPTAVTNAVSSVIAAAFALPGLVVALAIVFWAVRAPAFLFGLYQSFPLLIAAYVIHFGVQSLQATTSAIQSLPDSLPEAAGTLGANRWRRFRTIELPLLVPGATVGAGLVLLSVLKELPATLLLAPIGFQTLATDIWASAEEGFFAQMGAASLLLIALSALLTWFLVLRRQDLGRLGGPTG